MTDTQSAPRPLLAHPWRAVITVLVLVVVANLAVVVLDESDTSRPGRTFPSAIDTVDPEPGELIRPSDTITVDLRDDLTGVLVLDGPGGRVEIPEDQLDRVEPLGQLSFRPGPDRELTRFEPGEYTAIVLSWSQGEERPANPGSYSWRFRVGA
jgi:hypothetical protein